MATSAQFGDASSSCCNSWGRKRGNETSSSSNLGEWNIDHRDLLAEEMNQLTVKEREQIYEEIHGVSDIVEETPEFVASSLAKMREELSMVPKGRRKAWDRAVFLRPELEMDDKFHLMFLRCDRFDAEKSARKMCRHFEHKLMLFGDEALPRDITLDDLTEKELALMYRGANVFVPSSDRSGRTIRVLNIALYPYDDWKTFIRYAWYKIMVAVEDEEAQKRGCVDVLRFFGEIRYPVREMISFVKSIRSIVADWPLRFNGFHLCYGNPMLHSFISMMLLALGKDRRLRGRTHFGSKLETEYELMPFGIFLRDAFDEGQGLLSRESFESYIFNRRTKEQAKKKQREDLSKRTELIPYPEPADVMMGRSRRWSGNTRFSGLVNSYRAMYSEAPERLDKTIIGMELFKKIQAEGGRFIDRTDNGWKVVCEALVVDKTCQALRTATRKRPIKDWHQKFNTSPEMDILDGTGERSPPELPIPDANVVYEDGLLRLDPKRQRLSEREQRCMGNRDAKF